VQGHINKIKNENLVYDIQKHTMAYRVVIFINKDAIRLDDLFLNQNWSLGKFFGNVYTLTVNGKELDWVVKTYKSKKMAKRESENLYALDNVPGVPKILATGMGDKLNYIILSKFPGIDLYEYMYKHGVFSVQEVKGLCIQILTVLRDIHKRGVIHRDIKPENIVYDDKTGKIMLIDFEGKLTDNYCSPEQVLHTKITEKTDLWSFGCTIYTLVTGDTPFHTSRETLQKTPFWPKKWKEPFKDFLSCVLERNVHLRFTATEALNHEWLDIKP
jgi:serine/threonine protein kinase